MGLPLAVRCGALFTNRDAPAMDFVDLHTFRATVDTRGMTAAACMLCRIRPGVTARLTGLVQAWGCAWFERQGRGRQITPQDRSACERSAWIVPARAVALRRAVDPGSASVLLWVDATVLRLVRKRVDAAALAMQTVAPGFRRSTTGLPGRAVQCSGAAVAQRAVLSPGPDAAATGSALFVLAA